MPRINANGTQMRTNYQMDGQHQHAEEPRRASARADLPRLWFRRSTSSRAASRPSSGRRQGMVYNVVTPSGDQRHQRVTPATGSVAKAFSARPFFLGSQRPTSQTSTPTPSPAPSAVRSGVTRPTSTSASRKVQTRPLRRPRDHGQTPRTPLCFGITDSLGEGVVPSEADANFFIGKGDFQLNYANQLSVRYTLFDQVISDNITGGLTTLERSLDFDDRADGVVARS